MPILCQSVTVAMTCGMLGSVFTMLCWKSGSEYYNSRFCSCSTSILSVLISGYIIILQVYNVLCLWSDPEFFFKVNNVE